MYLRHLRFGFGLSMFPLLVYQVQPHDRQDSLIVILISLQLLVIHREQVSLGVLDVEIFICSSDDKVSRLQRIDIVGVCDAIPHIRGLLVGHPFLCENILQDTF